jgi:hypothetical protein
LILRPARRAADQAKAIAPRRTEMPNPDRNVYVSVIPVLTWASNETDYTVAYTYSQTGSDCYLPPVVNPGTGELNIRNIPAANGFGNTLVLHLFLDTSKIKDPKGAPLTGTSRWAEVFEGPNPGGNGAIWICATPPPNQPKNITPIPAPPSTSGGLRFDNQYLLLPILPDRVRRSQNFNFSFCMGWQLGLSPTVNRYQIIDPQVKGTGTGTSPIDGMELYEGDVDLD